MYKILIVEDDSVIAHTLEKHLASWGYQMGCVQDFQNVMKEFLSFDPQMVLMDLSLPFYNGYHWCDEIRRISQVPVIFISSASDNMNMVMAMSRGADDFIPKPFDLDVLVAKIQALMRRTYSFGGQSNLLEYQGAILNLGNTTLSYGEHTLELTKNDFRILQILFENAGKVVSRDSMMLRLWESDSFIDDNTLTVNVTRLRKKLETIGLPNLIVTKKGLGYMLQP